MNLITGTGDRVQEIPGNFFSLTGGSRLNTDLSKNLGFVLFSGIETYSSTDITYKA